MDKTREEKLFGHETTGCRRSIVTIGRRADAAAASGAPRLGRVDTPTLQDGARRDEARKNDTCDRRDDGREHAAARGSGCAVAAGTATAERQRTPDVAATFRAAGRWAIRAKHQERTAEG